jgi:hypothetical protein
MQAVHTRATTRVPSVKRVLVLVTLALGLTGVLFASPATAASTKSSTGTVVSATSSPYGTVLMVGSGPFAGYTLYQFSRNTAKACSTVTVTVGGMPLSCAGAETDKTADWPALTTISTKRPTSTPG